MNTPWFWKFRGNTNRQGCITQVQTQAEMESGIHPCWDVTLSKRKTKTSESQGTVGMGGVSYKQTQRFHQQRESSEEMRAHTVHCTAPWLEGRERHNKSILHLLGCETQCGWRWLWGAKLSGMVWKSKPVTRQVIQDTDTAFYSTHFPIC